MNMRRRGCFICIDAGTTRFKTAGVTPEGKMIASSNSYYPTSDEGLHEYKPDDIIDAFVQTVHDILGTIAGTPILGIGITGHGPTLIPVNRYGEPLFSGVGYLDDRVKKYIQRLVRKKSDKITSTMYIPIALFFKEELPKIYEKTATYLQSFDYLAYRLTGNPVASSSSSGIKPWEREKIERAGLDIDKFPSICYMGQEIGKTVPDAETQLGIPAGIPVFAIGVDFAAALVGTNMLHKGRSCERAGSSGGINLCWDRPVDDNRLLCYEHFIKNRWNIAGITSTYGKAIEWAKKTIGIEHVESLVAGRKPPRILFFPYLKGERTPLWNPYAKGMFIGLKESHDQVDIMIAVFMGIAYSIRDCIEIIEQHGCQFQSPIMTTGGGVQDDWFTQLKADVIGKTFVTSQFSDAELLGVAIVLGTSLGFYEDLGTAADQIVLEKKRFNQRAEKHAYYSELFYLYKEIRRSVAQHF
jgi:xylulokinase